MPDTQSPVEKTITIQHQAFTVSQPYAEGHPCTPAEAKALNQTRSENIRNNMAKAVTSARDEAGLTDKDQSLSDAALGELQALVSEYDSGYEFTLASVGGGRKSRDPIEVEAAKIARASIVAQLRDAGMTLKHATEKNPEALKNMIAELAESEAVIAEAKKIVNVRSKAADKAVDADAMNVFA